MKAKIVKVKTPILVLLILMITACSQKQELNERDSNQKIPKTPLEKLYKRYQHWQGTPYQLGGNTQKGIDCSGFVALTYQEEFNLQLPRTTLKQSKLKNEIAIGELKTGDLTFFKIIGKPNIRHVGIYLENNRFLHASTSNGVTVSDLKSKYWSQNYWKSIRVFNAP